MPFFNLKPSNHGFVILQSSAVNAFRAILGPMGLLQRQPAIGAPSFVNFGEHQSKFDKNVIPMFDSMEDAVIFEIAQNPAKARDNTGVTLLAVDVTPASKIVRAPAQHYQFQQCLDQIASIKERHRTSHEPFTGIILRRLHRTVTLNTSPIHVDQIRCNEEVSIKNWNASQGLKELAPITNRSIAKPHLR